MSDLALNIIITLIWFFVYCVLGCLLSIISANVFCYGDKTFVRLLYVMWVSLGILEILYTWRVLT